MITQIYSARKYLRRLFSFSEWLRLLLRHPATEHPHTAGLIIFKISDVTHQQFHALLTQEKLPFFKFLLEREHYQLHHYQPESSTDASLLIPADLISPAAAGQHHKPCPPMLTRSGFILVYLIKPWRLLCLLYQIYREMNRRRRHSDIADSVPVPLHTQIRQAWRRHVQDERMLQQALLEICSGCTAIVVELDSRGDPSTSPAAGVSHLRKHDHLAKRIWRAAAGIGRRDYVFWSAAYPPRPESVHDLKKTGFLLCPRGSFHRHVKLQECLSEDTIRAAAERLLQVLPKQLPRPAKPLSERPARIRIMTYNIHICLGMDGRVSPRRIARVIAEHHPDVVCLQEVDAASARTGGNNQPRIIADELGMEMVFNPVCECNGELYGDAILSHLPMRLIKKAFLPGNSPHRRVEQRGAIWVQLDVHGAALQVINTHLGLRGWEKKLQVEALLGEEWLSNPGIETPIIFCGDFNITPRSFLYTQIADVMQDAQDVAESAHSTFFTHWPVLRLDHVFASDDLKILDVKVPRNALVKVASDHLPLIVDVEFWVKPE